MATIAKAMVTLTNVNDAYSVVLSPDSCVIKADFDGTNPNLDAAFTDITVVRGETKHTYKLEVAAISNSAIYYQLGSVDAYTKRVRLTNIPADCLSGYLSFTVSTEDEYVTTVTFQYSVVRETSMLDWILDWENNKTKIGDSYLITPKLFVGKKVENQEGLKTLTGVYLGPDTVNTAGIYGYKEGEDVFHINALGAMIGGWEINKGGISTSNKFGYVNLLSDGNISYSNTEGNIVWKLDSKGNATFAQGNVTFDANGNAYFEGEINASQGRIAKWTIGTNALYNDYVRLDSASRLIGVVGHQSSAQNGADFIDDIKQYGGVYMNYTASGNYGLHGFLPGVSKNCVWEYKETFVLGSDNKIANWNFDNNSLYMGEKVNMTTMYTKAAGDITIGSNGLRGYSWYIDNTGDVSFAKGLVKFTSEGGTLVGWDLQTNRLSSVFSAIVSEPSLAGLYLSVDVDVKNTASSNLKSQIQEKGGVYLCTNGVTAELYASDKSKKQVFYLTTHPEKSCEIAGWKFNNTAIFKGEQCLSGFTKNTGDMTIGGDGIRGYKWRLEADGSAVFCGGNALLNPDGSGELSGGNIFWYSNGAGWIANKNILWDKDGNISFAPTVSMQWENGIQIAQMAAFGQMLFRDPEFTLGLMNGTHIYPYEYYSYVTINLSSIADTINKYGLFLSGENVCISKIEIIGDNESAISTYGIWPTYLTDSNKIVKILNANQNVKSSNKLKIWFEDNGGFIKIGTVTAYDEKTDVYTYQFDNLHGTTPVSSCVINKSIPSNRSLIHDDSAPNSTKYVVNINSVRWNKYNDYRIAGIYFSNKSRANAKFVVKIIAKIPIGWKIENYHNSYGNGGKTQWATSQSGTGDWFEYMCLVTCGSSGSFNTINHFALICDEEAGYVADTSKNNSNDSSIYILKSGSSTKIESVNWQIAYATIFDATSSDKVTTTIDKNGIYTGTLRADQIVAGTIDATKISADVILSNGNAWALNKDGSGYLANKNILWDKDGNVSVNGEISAVSGNIGKWYIVNGLISSDKTGSATDFVKLDSSNRKIVLQTSSSSYNDGSYNYNLNSGFGAIITLDGSNGIIEACAKSAPSYSTATSYLSSNGIFSNIAGINGMPASSGYTQRGAIVGLGFANVNKSNWSMNEDETIVAGVYGRASNSGTAPAYGGFFYQLKACGLTTSTYYFTDDDNGKELPLDKTTVIGLINSKITNTLYLPHNAHEGQEVEIMQMGAGVTRIDTNDGTHIYDDTSENEYYDCPEGWVTICKRVRYVINKVAYDIWAVHQYKFK